jgi:hypothetical protein
VLALGIEGEPRGETMARPCSGSPPQAVLTGDHARDRDSTSASPSIGFARTRPLPRRVAQAGILLGPRRAPPYGVTAGAGLQAMPPLAPGSAAPLAVVALFSLYYGLLLLVAALGAFLARRDLALWAILLALPLGVTALNMWVYLEARNMLPSYPGVVLAAGLGLEAWLAGPGPRWGRLRQRRSGAGAGPGARPAPPPRLLGMARACYAPATLH